MDFNISDILDEEILYRLTPKAKEVVEDIYISISSAYMEKGEIKDAAWSDAMRGFTFFIPITTILEKLSNNLLRNFFNVIGSGLRDEYSYGLFENRMINFIRGLPSRDDYSLFLNVRISPTPTSKPVSVSFDRDRAFGDPESYIRAARRAYKARNEDIKERSRQWKFFYLKGREGYVPTPKNPQGKRIKLNPVSLEKRRRHYAAKYKTAILNRLDEHEKAGFWYFIEYGNVEFRELEGTPYPLYSSPTGFIRRSLDELELELNKEFLTFYDNARLNIVERISAEEFRKSIDDFINGIIEGFANDDKSLIRTNIRFGEELNRRLVINRSKTFGYRIGVRKV